MTWEPLAVGLVATGLAVAQILGWLALGSCFLKNHCDDIISIPSSLLIGSGLTAFVYAIFAATGHVQAGIVFGIVAVVVPVTVFRQRLVQMSRSLSTGYTELGTGRRWFLAPWTAALVLFWALAITPPRDADVMRYHLAHIQQIDMENAWLPVPDWHYALPFGWTLNYLAFEHFGIPQVANLINLGLWIIISASLFQILRQQAGIPLALLTFTLAAYHPYMLKMATTAFADMYTIFAMLLITILIVRLPKLNLTLYGLLGFAAWIGIQSRYQAMAIGLSVTLFMCFLAFRGEVSRHAIVSYCTGAGCAWVLGSPFYVFNLLAFKNPVWPLMVHYLNGLTTYADQVADALTSSITGSFTFTTLLSGLQGLLIEPSTFPIPILAIGLLSVSVYTRTFPVVSITFLVVTYLLIWAWAQPMLEPRFSMYLIPLISVGWALVLADWVRSQILKPGIITACFVSLLLVFILFAAIYSYDSLEYLFAGDLARYHRFTLFYGVFDWVNRETPNDARFLVILSSGQSYYLNRPYRRADPELSGVVDWSSLKGAADFEQILEGGGYTYVLYEDKDWGDAVGGSQMRFVVKEAIQKGLLAKLAVFHPQLFTLRILRRSISTTVLVLKRKDRT